MLTLKCQTCYGMGEIPTGWGATCCGYDRFEIFRRDGTFDAFLIIRIILNNIIREDL